jgi:hypothetical protein
MWLNEYVVSSFKIELIGVGHLSIKSVYQANASSRFSTLCFLFFYLEIQLK